MSKFLYRRHCGRGLSHLAVPVGMLVDDGCSSTSSVCARLKTASMGQNIDGSEHH